MMIMGLLIKVKGWDIVARRKRHMKAIFQKELKKIMTRDVEI